MRTVVISQSMLFPWVGMLEQIRLADTFVHYDDVQFSKGSFVNRVQIKTPQGMKWMTVPVRQQHLGQRINEVAIAEGSQWVGANLSLLARTFDGLPHAQDALALAERVFSVPHPHIGALSRASMRALSDYFELSDGTRFIDVGELGIAGKSSVRVRDIVQALGGDVYVTGHGASRYLEHALFEQAGIDVQYMTYERAAYAQAHGEFTPYVSGLDLVANCGRAGAAVIRSGSQNWRAFLAAQAGM
jgi:hypothetical protein